jgi:hypothetical protein
MKYSKIELINYMTDFYNIHGRTPKMEDFAREDYFPPPLIYFRKFGSWNKALNESGLRVNVRKDYTKKELLNLLRKKSKELGRAPKGRELKEDINLPSEVTYSNYFGTLNNAVEIAGLKIEKYNRKWEKEELLRKLKEKATQLNKTPTQKDIDKDPLIPGKGNYQKYFGSFTKAVRLAGLDVNYGHSKEELVKIIQKLARKINKTPTRTDMNNAKGYPSYIPFVRKFGSYSAACLRAGLTPNDGRNNKIWQGWEKHCIEMAKVIYKGIEVKKGQIVEGVPDIYVSKNALFIDAKTCGYKEFREQVKKYCRNGHKLEFWCIFKGMENRSKKVKYVYAKELAEKMEKYERGDLSAKCYQFIKNIYSEEQTVLT